MDSIKSIIGGSIITLVIGGAAYSISTVDVARNFAEDTGFTQEQAEEYIESIPEDELTSWDEIGSDFLKEGSRTLELANEIDCETYEYEWESSTLSCPEGQWQLIELAGNEKALGNSFIKLGSDSASNTDIQETMRLLEAVNEGYTSELVMWIYDPDVMGEIITTNLYNKAILQTALESE